MGDSMRSIVFETAYPNVTNDDPVGQLPDILDRVARHIDWVAVNNPAALEAYGGRAQVELFRRYYKVCVNYIPPVYPSFALDLDDDFFRSCCYYSR
jgi:hypothetical protein